ncbi:MAG: T9SS type A sorting domain-containing protein [Candidatus Kapaibacterium sp.]
MKYNILILMMVANLNSKDCITINHVFSFTPGEGQNLGQGEEFYPANIFGIPSRIASDEVAEASESEVLSLGFGGEIIVGNSDNLIIDGEGADFTIFENVFKNPINGRLFKEPAIVSVSKDGVNYTEFLYDFESLVGCAGTHPTYGNADYCDSEVSGGDSFDLADLGLDSIRYIKIKDITDQVKANENHKYFDYSLSGFDLDALVIHHYTVEAISSVSADISKLYTLNNSSISSYNASNTIQIYNINGILVAEYSGIGVFQYRDLQSGVYIMKISNSNGTAVEKIINL